MINKIALIIAILAGVGALCVGHFMVDKRIKDGEAALETTKTELQSTQSAKDKLAKDLKKTTEELDKTSNELASTKTELQGKTTELAAAQKSVEELNQKADKLNKDLATAKAENAEFFKLGQTTDQIKKTYADLKKTIEERDISIQEKKILQLTINRLENKIIELKGPIQTVELPKGLKAKVVAVDPKYDFVILNIGGDQGVKQYGEMLVSRDGVMVSKVRIVSVEADHSVANVLTAWKKGEILEGDVVMAQ